ncbi:MAG: hypothetical protein RL662_71 [Bacteroidota bacterium]
MSTEIVSTIKNSLPINESIGSFLMDLFCWSKESMYRRLRGEIPFTYEEIVVIALKLDFSIDSLIGMRDSERALFDLILHKSTEPEDIYYEKIQMLTQFLEEVRESDSQNALLALNYIPYFFSMYLEFFPRFIYYKWLHQAEYIAPDCKMEEVSLPEKIINLRNYWDEKKTENSRGILILDRDIFVSALRDIDYFYRRNLINTEELQQLKADLLSLIDYLDYFTREEELRVGAKIEIYLSSINIPTSYSCFEYGGNTCCHIQIYGMDILMSHYPEAYLIQKQWIEQLKRYSTLITKSNEIERFEYFKQQRAYIQLLGEESYS